MTFRADLHDWIRDTLDVPVRAVRISEKPMLPAIAYNQIAGDEPISHSGRTGLVRRHMQLDVWAGNDDDIERLANQLRRLLNGFRGVMGGSEVASVEYAGEHDLADPNPRFFRRAIDFYFTEREMP